MGRRIRNRTIALIREQVRSGACLYSLHAFDEMRDEDLLQADVERAVGAGVIVATLTRDDRGTRYAIRGPGLDGRPVGVICRILRSDRIRTVTVFRIYSEDPHEEDSP